MIHGESFPAKVGRERSGKPGRVLDDQEFHRAQCNSALAALSESKAFSGNICACAGRSVVRLR
jgi:hypothetical protein